MSEEIASSVPPPSFLPIVPQRRALTLHHQRGQKARGFVIGSPDGTEDVIDDPYFSSDASGIATSRRGKSSQHQHQMHVVPQTAPEGHGYITHNNISHSAGDLLSCVDSAAGGSSSDEGEMVAECFICYNAFDEKYPGMAPRNLQCGHAFCTDCLQKVLLQSLHMTEIDCPLCHFVTLTEGCTVTDLPKNYPLMSMIRCLDSTRQERKWSRHIKEDAPLQPPKCAEHDDYLRSYCLKDGTLVCSSCVLYGSHRNHPTKFLSEAALSERRRLKELNIEVFKQKQRLKVALSGVEGTCRRVQESGGRLEDEVDGFFQEVLDLVEERRRRAKTDIRGRTQLRVKALLDQAQEMKECISRAEAVNIKANGLLKSDVDDYKLLSDAMLTFEQIEGVFTRPPPMVTSARDDLKVSFLSGVKDDLAESLARSTTITPDIGTIDSSKIKVEPYHDGFRISWEQQSFADNHAISYHLQLFRGEEEGDEQYVNIYRGPATKFTWKVNLSDDITYKFRVRVQTTEGVGNWSQPKEAKRADPSMRWHSKWRSVKVDLSPGHLEAAGFGASSHHWATFAADRLFEKNAQYYTEIEILSIGKSKSKDRLAIGLVGCKRTNPNNVEWQNHKEPIGEWKGTSSWSFLPFSGLLKSHSIAGEGIPYGQDLMIQAGDRVGVLVDLAEGKLTYFCNGSDLGVAFDGLEEQPFLLAVSVRDKFKVRLLFPPPPYHKRQIKLIKLQSNGSFCVSGRSPGQDK